MPDTTFVADLSAIMLLLSRRFSSVRSATHFLQFAGLAAQILDLVGGRCTDRIPIQAPLARFLELLRPDITSPPARTRSFPAIGPRSGRCKPGQRRSSRCAREDPNLGPQPVRDAQNNTGRDALSKWRCRKIRAWPMPARAGRRALRHIQSGSVRWLKC